MRCGHTPVPKFEIRIDKDGEGAAPLAIAYARNPNPKPSFLAHVRAFARDSSTGRKGVELFRDGPPESVLLGADDPSLPLAPRKDVEGWRGLDAQDVLDKLLAALVLVPINAKKEGVRVMLCEQLVLGFELLARLAEGEADLEHHNPPLRGENPLELLRARHVVHAAAGEGSASASAALRSERRNRNAEERFGRGRGRRVHLV